MFVDSRALPVERERDDQEIGITAPGSVEGLVHEPHAIAEHRPRDVIVDDQATRAWMRSS